MDAEYRKERIERLFYELRHEITRGMMEREIDEEITFQFIVPRSRHFPDGIVLCEFRTRPNPYPIWGAEIHDGPKLKLVK